MKNTEQLLDLQAYVDGELTEERRRQVEAALPADLDAQVGGRSAATGNPDPCA